MPVVARGGNYEITIERAIARARVFRRPDVDSAEGARFAEDIRADVLRAIDDPLVRGAIVDVREAPPVTGPSTRATLGRLAAACGNAGRRLAFVPGDHPTQRLQLSAIVSDHAATSAAVCLTIEAAEAWVLRGEPPPSSGRAPSSRRG